MSWHQTHQAPAGASSARTNGSSAVERAEVEPSSDNGASPAPTASVAGPGDAPYPISFAQIVELISTGQPIPGIKDIPNTVLEGQSSESTKPRRRKPWEKDEVVPAVDAALPASSNG